LRCAEVRSMSADAGSSRWPAGETTQSDWTSTSDDTRGDPSCYTPPCG
jgi:hypothetical protein